MMTTTTMNDDGDEAAETDKATRIKGNLPQAQILAKRIGYILADPTILSLSDELLYDLLDKIMMVQAKLQNEVEFREAKNVDKAVNLSSLAQFGLKPNADQVLARIFCHDDIRRKEADVANGIVAFFREHNRWSFTMDEAITVVHELGDSAVTLKAMDDNKLNIRLGQLFGLNGMRLRQVQNSDRKRLYLL